MLLEQQRARRWGIFFKLLTFGLLFVALSSRSGRLRPANACCLDKCTALVDVRRRARQRRPGERRERVIAGAAGGVQAQAARKGVVLRINSPGGSPVQAGQINDEIRRLRGKYPETPMHAVVEEICASGGYYVAAAADKIYVDKASLVGSIGVIMDGFGFVGAMEKLGVERRVLTAGENKAFLDPFRAGRPKQQAYAQQMLDEIHQQFIAAVKAGPRHAAQGIARHVLRAGLERPAAASNWVWPTRSGSVDSVARDVIKAEDMVDFTPQENLAERVARRFGAAIGAASRSTHRHVPVDVAIDRITLQPSGDLLFRLGALASPSTRSPARIARSANQPFFISRAYSAGPCETWVARSCGAMSSMFTMRPSAPMNAIDSGMIGVLHPEASGCGASNTNSMP